MGISILVGGIAVGIVVGLTSTLSTQVNTVATGKQVGGTGRWRHGDVGHSVGDGVSEGRTWAFKPR